MAKEKIFGIVLGVVLCICLLLTNCKKSDEETIIGTWKLVKVDFEEVNKNNSMSFYEDGSVILISDDKTEQAKYYLTDNNIVFNVGQYNVYTYTCGYKLDGKKLYIYNFEDSNFELEKQ